MQDPDQRHAVVQAAYHWTEPLVQSDFTHSFQETRLPREGKMKEKGEMH